MGPGPEQRLNGERRNGETVDRVGERMRAYSHAWRLAQDKGMLNGLEGVIGDRRVKIATLDHRLAGLGTLKHLGLLNRQDYQRERDPLATQRKFLSGLQSQDRNRLRPMKRVKETRKSPF